MDGLAEEIAVVQVRIRRVTIAKGKDVFRAYVRDGATNKDLPMYMGAYTPSKVIDGLRQMWPLRRFQFVIEGKDVQS